jgi:hypothetical protein
MLAVIALAGCDRGWFLWGRNTTDEAAVIRLVTPAFTSVFRLPPGFHGHLETEIGTLHDATVELVDTDCSTIQSESAPAEGDVLVTVLSDEAINVEPTAHPSNADELPGAEEIEGECGSTSAP